jgi:hypothetical protein
VAGVKEDGRVRPFERLSESAERPEQILLGGIATRRSLAAAAGRIRRIRRTADRKKRDETRIMATPPVSRLGKTRAVREWLGFYGTVLAANVTKPPLRQ